jgi:alcohol dehydrogenase class IV
MKDFNCHLPTKVLFGAGRIRLLGEVTKDFGQRALLVIDPYLDQSGLGDEIVSSLRRASIETVKFTNIHPNPICFEVDKGVQIAKQNHCGVVIGVGGGSTIDTAKAVAVLCKDTGTAWEHTKENIPSPKEILPIIAVPTTAGTGSEVTPWSVISNPDEKDKRALSHYNLFPQIALIDPEVMISMPRGVTASSGMDAFSHSLESFISSYATPYSKLMAKESIKTAARYLPEAVANGNNLEARSQMAWASMLGGMAITHARTVVPHALGTAASALFDAPHGGSIAACLVAVLERSFVGNLELFAELSEILDDSTKCLPLRERAERSSHLVRRLLSDMDYQVRLGDFGIGEKDIDALIDWLVSSSFWSDFRAHPKFFTVEEVKQIFKECL